MIYVLSLSHMDVLLLETGGDHSSRPPRDYAVAAEETADEEDDFAPGPTHIPFGPYMVVGAFLSVFVGDALIRWYLAWTGLSG